MKAATIFQIPQRVEEKDVWFEKIVQVLKNAGFKFYTEKKPCPSCGNDMFLIEHEWICVQCQHKEIIN